MEDTYNILFDNELRQRRPCKTLSLVVTYKKFTKKKQSFSILRLNIACLAFLTISLYNSICLSFKLQKPIEEIKHEFIS